MPGHIIGKTVRFKIPPEVYSVLEEKIRAHRKSGVYYASELFYRVFMTGLEALGSDGVEKLIVDIKTRKEERWKRGGEPLC